MAAAAKPEDFEAAATYRNRVYALTHVRDISF